MAEPTREQIAETIYRGAHKWEDLAWQHKETWYERADAVIALLSQPTPTESIK